jgi:hypothetical protein
MASAGVGDAPRASGCACVKTASVMRALKQQITRFTRERINAKATPNANSKSEIHPVAIRDTRRSELMCWSRMARKCAQTRHPLGLTITVARQKSKTVSELSFLTAVHTAKGIGKQKGFSEIFCLQIASRGSICWVTTAKG